MKKELGKIKSVKFGNGGYQGVQFGLTLDFEFKGSGCGAFIAGGWTTDPGPTAKWNEADRLKTMGEMCMQVVKLLSDAKVDDVAKLKGAPVECTFDPSFKLVDWRILTEVI